MTTAKISPFPQTPISQETDRETVSTTQSVSTTTRAYAREDEIDEIVDQVGQYYRETFGAAVLPPIAQARIRICLTQGMSDSLIYTAIDEAAVAPRPSWAYANAILCRLLQEDCLTMEAYIARQERWRARRSRW